MLLAENDGGAVVNRRELAGSSLNTTTKATMPLNKLTTRQTTMTPVTKAQTPKSLVISVKWMEMAQTTVHSILLTTLVSTAISLPMLPNSQVI